ncbi:MAG: FHA domain-containing protein [Anaerolineae bacterium]|nr:FHA domain-containing protein [Anaerolineae bacterium]
MAHIQSVRLFYHRQGEDWQEKALAVGTYVVGRSSDADIQFDASNISRRHFQLAVSDEGVQIIDLGSSNGTHVEGKPITANVPFDLQSGQPIRAGLYEAYVEWQTTAVVSEYVEEATSFRPPEPLMATQVESEEGEATQLDAPADGRLETPAVVYPVLTVTMVDGTLSEKVLPDGQYVIGRTSAADIQIAETKVSRLHARITVRDGLCTVEDVGSSNGTMLNGTPLTPHVQVPFSAGQVLMICGCRLQVTAVEGAEVPHKEKPVEATRIETVEEAAGTVMEGVIAEAATALDGGMPEQATALEMGLEAERTALGEMPADWKDRTNLDAMAPVVPLGDTSGGVVLRFRRGGGEWDQITLRPGEYVLGRSEQADLSMPDHQISRRHAKLIVDAASGVFLMDLGSANGTQINGSPLRPREPVPFGKDQIASIGGYQMQVVELTGDSRTLLEVAKTEIGEVMVGATQVVSVKAPVLRYRQGSAPWQEFQLVNGEQVLGRSSEAHLRIPSGTISRQHARLFVQEGQVWITDLASKNGITINGQRIAPERPMALPMGQTFTVDDFEFQLLGGAEQPAGYDATRISGNVGACILEPGKMDMLLNMPAAVGAGDQTMIGAEMGIDMAMLGAQQAQAPINLAGHDRVTIGRGSDNMITLDHPLVSRYHAVIERMGTRTRITDLHSANGVFVNGEAVDTQAWLKQGDAIKIGPYLIHFTGNELRPSAQQSYNIDVLGLQKWVTKDLNLLKEISLNVGQNEFVALVGMSGAGKSTLMDAINGFRPATHGQVFINGVDLYQNYNQFRDEIGNVPQRDIVHMELTAEQALDYAAQLRMPPDASAGDRRAAVNETLDDLGLTFRKDVLISRLSGGQLKRVSIGVELLTKPRLFFLDEPTSGLDPGTEYEMMKLLRRLADQGRTIMIITHATKNVMFCDKAIILAKGGNLAFYGPPEDALQYFDQFRTRRERLEKDMEFDDIYRILEDPERGRPEDWRDRYLQSPYARYTMPKQAGAPQMPQAQAGASRKHAGKRISGFKQFFILSHRYLRCMLQDKASLILTLSLAPILGLMNFIWGNKLFDPVNGNAAKTMGVWFAVAIMGILVGYMGSIQELVKEQAIYKRERAVGLKILPYIMSKVWVGAALGLYQAFFILVFTLLLAQPVINNLVGYVVLYITLWLVIFCSFILGLLISAVANNPNTAQLIMIATFVPQILLAGVLQPLHLIIGGETMSVAVVARWGFENFVNATGMGDPLVNDQCWSELDRDTRNSLTGEQKDALCVCMGSHLFDNCGSIPGILSHDFYDEEAQIVLAMQKPEQPVEPNRLPTPTPRHTPTLLPSPTFYPSPTYLPTPTPWMTPTPKPVRIHVDSEECDDGTGTGWSQEKEDCVYAQYQQEVAWQQYEVAQQMEVYQKTREAQFEVYRDDTEDQFMGYRDEVEGQFEEYKEDVSGQIERFADEERANIEDYAQDNMDVFQAYKEDMEVYSDDLSYYERTRQEAISSAEAILGILWDDFGRAFRGSGMGRMLYIALITFVEFIALLIMMKRKDTI